MLALTWDDADLVDGGTHVRQRPYRGELDVPKSNEERTIALTDPARAALLSLPERHGTVFVSKTGKRMAAATSTSIHSPADTNQMTLRTRRTAGARQYPREASAVSRSPARPAVNSSALIGCENIG